MADIIEHQGFVENIHGSHVTVRIIQTSACAACSVKGHCSAADTREKSVDIITNDALRYHPGDAVTVYGKLSMGIQAVSLAFIIPFIILIVTLFAFMAMWHNEVGAALASLALLIPYYYIVWLCRGRLKRQFSFSIRPST
ncbi:MAG: SoxR reducing system RseC family protein [Prevotellaceae bacterium]|jgi:sigma-E factor negative regulatory protein RseC|nr:SoxR reducing system RseC family protein [Prevotellaceae bacterium]